MTRSPVGTQLKDVSTVTLSRGQREVAIVFEESRTKDQNVILGLDHSSGD